MVGSAGAAGGDHLVDQRIKASPRVVGAAEFRNGQLLEQVGAWQQIEPEALEHFRDRGAHFVRARFDVGVEERLASNRQRQAHHLPGDVERLLIAPSRGCPRGVVDHHLPVASDAIAVKRRLEQPAMSQVGGALSREQAVAEQLLRAFEAAALGEVALMRDEHVADGVWIVDEVAALAAKLEKRDVAVLARKAREHLQRVAAWPDQRAEHREPGSGRQRGARLRHTRQPTGNGAAPFRGCPGNGRNVGGKCGRRAGNAKGIAISATGAARVRRRRRSASPTCAADRCR